MKQIRLPAALLALILTLTACGQQLVFQRGTVEGQTYTSEFLGLTCEAPEDFSYLSDEEIARLNDITLESMTNEALSEEMRQQLEDGSQVQDMYLMTEDGRYWISITIDQLENSDIDMDAFIASGVTQAESAYQSIDGMEDVASTAQTVTFMGGQYSGIITTAAYNGFPVCSLQVCIPLEQYICAITFTSYVEDRTDEMMTFFSAVPEA